MNNGIMYNLNRKRVIVSPCTNIHISSRQGIMQAEAAHVVYSVQHIIQSIAQFPALSLLFDIPLTPLPPLVILAGTAICPCRASVGGHRVPDRPRIKSGWHWLIGFGFWHRGFNWNRGSEGVKGRTMPISKQYFEVCPSQIILLLSLKISSFPRLSGLSCEITVYYIGTLSYWVSYWVHIFSGWKIEE